MTAVITVFFVRSVVVYKILCLKRRYKIVLKGDIKLCLKRDISGIRLRFVLLNAGKLVREKSKTTKRQITYSNQFTRVLIPLVAFCGFSLIL